MPADATPDRASRPAKNYRISTRPATRSKHVEAEEVATGPGASSVQDRIRQWQAQGAADAVAPDAVSVRSMPLSDCASVTSKPVSEYGSEFRVRVGGRDKSREDIQVEKERSKSTPRKRVISDGHWKSTRGSPSKGSRPTAQQRSESRRYDPTYTSNEPSRRDRRRSRVQTHDSPQTKASPGTLLPDDGIRVTALSQAGSLRSDGSAPGYDADSHIDDDMAQHLDHTSSWQDDARLGSDHPNLLDDGDLNYHKPSRYAEVLGRGSEPVDAQPQANTKRARLLGKAKDKLMKSENVPTISHRLPSIEAWLDEQSDPFIDDGAVEQLPPAEIPEPLQKHSRRKQSSREPSIVADPNQIWDSVSPQSDPQVRASRRKSGSEQTPASDEPSTPKARQRRETDQEEQDGSPSTLRRRGARARRPRESSRSHTLGRSTSPDHATGAKDSAQPTTPIIDPVTLPTRSCPPTGAHRLQTIPSVDTFQEPIDPKVLQRPRPGVDVQLSRKLTTNDDLMSVLSVPRRSRNRRSTKRARGSRANYCKESAKDILADLATDEQKYGRELKTMVDGVIPVLLQCVLSKTDFTAAAGLFTSSASSAADSSITKPIIDMGIALERLKTLHGRIPVKDVDALLGWAKSAERAYRDYLQAWRLGFQDLVVSLAPLDKSGSGQAELPLDEKAHANGEEKSADVAYLLKRPLVRVKALSKTFTMIKEQYDIDIAIQVQATYDDLTALAKRRNQEEQARLEDEAAAAVDHTRARDIRTLTATTNATINRNRRVKARDFFNLTLYHSSGQRLDCGIEMVFRDNAREEPSGGDVLICEVDEVGKWLLFAPIEHNHISVRRGEDGFDLVIMVRGRAGLGQEWHELLALKTEDKEAVTEWVNMLGSKPLPPRLNRTPDFVPPPAPLALPAPEEPRESKSDVSSRKLESSTRPHHVDVPMGEPSVLGGRSDISRHSAPARPSPGLSLGGGLAPKAVPQYQPQSMPVRRRPVASAGFSDRTTISDRSIVETASTLTSSSARTTSTQSGHVSKQRLVFESSAAAHQSLPAKDRNERSERGPNELERDRARIDHRGLAQNPEHTTTANLDRARETRRAKSHDSRTVDSVYKASTSSEASPKTPAQRPVYHRALSSTPSKELPTVNKIRGGQSPERASVTLPAEESRNPGQRRHNTDSLQDQPRSDHRSSAKSNIYTEDVPPPPTHSLRQHRQSLPNRVSTSTPPATPPHKSSVLQPISNNKNSLVLKPTPSPLDKILKRRGSSPLKHEYAPSTSSGSSSDSASESDSDTSSDTSESFVAEKGDVSTPLVAVTAGERRPSRPATLPYMPPSSYQSSGTRTLAPSDSASQGPYRTVPASATVPSQKKFKTIALICSWSDRGMWEQVFPDECSIIVTPGLIEAFEMSAFHSNSQVGTQSQDDESRTSSLSRQPVVAFELTPIVPLRRGTALDISIRSPPTVNSKIRTTNNVMFRSRNPEECETLYGMINWARCNNPTYIQLQSARPGRQPSVSFAVGQAQHSRGRTSSWFSFGSQKESSYRASSAPTPASVDMSVESSGTRSSAFSALKRLGVSNAFNLNRSSIHRKNGHSITSDSLYSSSSGGGTGSGTSTPLPSQAGFIPGKDGPNVPSTSAAAAEGAGMINNMKIRLYVRKGQHWDNLGAARLTVLPPHGPNSGANTPSRCASLTPGTSPPSTPNIIGQPGQNRGPRLPSSNHTPHRVHGDGREKRILITHSKNRDVVLLDSVLGESCFERVMQTGIAVKVWSEEERVAERGGVTMGRETVYMLQFPGGREAGWVFGLCGMYRYGGGE